MGQLLKARTSPKLFVHYTCCGQDKEKWSARMLIAATFSSTLELSPCHGGLEPNHELVMPGDAESHALQ